MRASLTLSAGLSQEVAIFYARQSTLVILLMNAILPKHRSGFQISMQRNPPPVEERSIASARYSLDPFIRLGLNSKLLLQKKTWRSA